MCGIADEPPTAVAQTDDDSSILPRKVVKTFAISSELTAVNFWPRLDQWAGVGPHRAEMGPLNQLPWSKRQNYFACSTEGVEIVVDWGLETVAEIPHKLPYISVNYYIFTQKKLNRSQYLILFLP